MTDLEITGPALRLVYKFLGDTSLTDAEKVEFAGALLGLVGDHQAETATHLQAAIKAAGIVPAPGWGEAILAVELDLDDLIPRQPYHRPDWGLEDDRLAVHSRIADIIDMMPIEQLERVLEVAKAIADET